MKSGAHDLIWLYRSSRFHYTGLAVDDSFEGPQSIGGWAHVGREIILLRNIAKGPGCAPANPL